MDVDVVEPRLLVLPDLLDVELRVRTAQDHLGDLVLGDALDEVGELRRVRQLLADLAVERRRGPPLVGDPSGGRLGLRPADRQLADQRTGAAGILIRLHQCLSGAVAINPSPMRAARSAMRGPLAATRIGGSDSGREYNLAFWTR